MAARTDRYQPFYCEENVWWLAQRDDLAECPRWVLFITGERGVLMRHQRAAPESAPVVWDYHVILVVRRGDLLEAWDHDTRLGMPSPLLAYLEASFPPLPDALARWRPRFRVVEADELVARFSTDRGHMRALDGSYLRPPPPWPPPGPPMRAPNLLRFLDLSDPIAGEVLDLERLVERSGSGTLARP
jgi:hypothetical protein